MLYKYYRIIFHDINFLLINFLYFLYVFDSKEVIKGLERIKNRSMKDIWLFNAVSYRNVTVTNGCYDGYGDYCGLEYYYEEISTLTSQNEGVKGTCSTNVTLSLFKSEGSLALYNEFIANNIFKSMQLLQVVKVGDDLKIKQNIQFFTCKIDTFKIFMDKVTFTVKYNSREEQFTVLDGTGQARGFGVSIR